MTFRELVPETPMPCPEDGCDGTLRRQYSARFDRYWYACERWPATGCRGSIGCSPQGRALGFPVNQATKLLRNAAHEAFDVLWDTGEERGRNKRRTAAYAWLAAEMGVANVHIAELDAEGCKRVVEIMQARAALLDQGKAAP